jgi:hypothetical protein
MTDLVAHYPELDGKELAALLEQELLRLGAGVKAERRHRVNRVSRYWANVERSSRTASVTVAAEERLFMADFWDQGVKMGSALTPSVSEAVDVIDAFLAGGLRVAQLHDRFPFFTLGEQAEAHESGAAAEVAWQWKMVRDHIADCLPDLLPLADLILTTCPPLKQLFPYISLEALCFSRCTGQPFSSDCPAVTALGPGDFEVRNNRGVPLGRGDAATALHLLTRNLPANAGPAVQGTANDLNR